MKVFTLAVCSSLVVGISAQEDQFRTGSPGNVSFDYVVIGGGTAGLAIASRLSTYFTVAVIEAGGLYERDNGNQSTVPYYSLILPFLGTTEDYPKNSLMDWDLISTPQPGAGNRRIHYAQGKTLGGSSAINTMAYHRATRGAYAWWAELVGDDGFRYEKMERFFKRSATLTPPNLKKRNAPNATVLYDEDAFDYKQKGPLQVSWGNWVDPTQSWLARALQGIGQTLSKKGFSSGELDGGAWVPSTIDPQNATRSSSKTSYLKQALAKDGKLTVYLHSQVSKILFDKSKTTTGVAVSSEGKKFVISAKKEVILSAGVFHSPQLLMLSGIGDPSTLSTHSIPLISALPGVGQNLWDQIFFNVLRSISIPNTGTYLTTPTQQSLALAQYHQNASGPYSSAGGYLSFERLPSQSRARLSSRTTSLLAQFPTDWPDLEFIASGFPSGSANPPTIGVISATLLTPLSRGTVTLRSANISDAPVINLNWLSDPADTELLLAAFKRVRLAWNHPSISNITLGQEIVPGDAVQTDEQIVSFLRGAIQPIWHASSTCRMGRRGDKNAVVDKEGRVFGVKGIRVVDNSVVPVGMPGHPVGTVYALAEKIADGILEGS
ncbi:GMC oxidoreductase-like protein [Dendryphion nanum]|uniref:GMC oxidoreductase-like protein n=1 Tax=Dendryphion nanum TaxID=256645 RepID=A0A9P9D0K1_9PLEO|nr:GMC oxidoreductase-like protein [Dendryphion nanum]